MRNHSTIFRLFLLLLFSFESLWAARTITVAPGMYRGLVDYTQCWGGACVQSAQGWTGIAVEAIVHITNISDETQAGQVTLLDSTVGAGEAGDEVHFFIVNGISCEASVAVANKPSRDLTVSFTVPGKRSSSFKTGLTILRKTTGIGWANYVPRIKILINEEKGAVIASLTPSYDWIGPGLADCVSGISSYGPSSVRPVAPHFDATPIPLNGGRPF